MTNAVIERAPWLEPHDRFEGVGAHELNPRYDHVDGGGFDEALTVSRRTVPALVRAQRRLTLTRPLVRLLGLAPQLDGMDGAHYQFDHGKPDLRVMRDAGLWWIGWKASQSTGYVDPTFAQIRREWGEFENRLPYHWLSSTTDPVAQADWYLKQLNELRPGEAVMLDIEEAGDTVEKALAFFERTEEYTHRPGVGYSGIYVAGGSIWKSPELRMSKYGRRPFTVAAYVTEANLRARLAATHSPDPDAWQYSSNGPVPGIVGRCDMDMVFDKPAFQLACGNTATPIPDPQPEDDMAYIVCNLEAQDGTEGPGVGANGPRGNKFRVREEGDLVPLSGTDLKAMGIANSVALGIALTNAELAEMGYYDPASPIDFKLPVTMSLSLSGGASGTVG